MTNTIDATHDTTDLTMTITASFGAPPERVWQVLEDPRRLERWWGPPDWPATFTRHEPVVGGSSAYYMTGPDGEKAGGWWNITAVEPPTRLEFEDGFSDAEGNPDLSMPVTRTTMTISGGDDGSTLTVLTRFATLEQLEQLMAMGMREGMTAAMGQIAGILAE